MFERFTKDAREVVQGAVDHSKRTGAGAVEAEHMLLALFDREGSRASFALGSLRAGERRGSIETALAAAARRGGLSGADEAALAELGIDLSEVVSRVEAAHGAGAMATDAKGRKTKGRTTHHRPFTRGAKETLEKSLRIAVAHRDRHIGDEHLLLALLARPGIPSEILADHGVTYEAVERVLYGGGAAKAG